MGIWRYKQYILLAVFTLVLFFILSSVGIFGITEHVRSARLIFIMLALLSMFLYYVSLSLNYIVFFKLRFFPALFTILSGEFFNIISPGIHVAGEPLKAYILSKLQQRPFADQFSAVLSIKIIDLIWYLIFGAVSLFFAVLFVELPPQLALLAQALVILVVFAAITIILLRSAAVRDILDSLLGMFLRFFQFLYRFTIIPSFSYLQSRIDLTPLLAVKHYVHGGIRRVTAATQTFITQGHASFRRVFIEKKLFFPLFIFTFAGWMFIFLKTYFVFLAFGYPVSFLFAVLAWMLPSFLGSLLFIPGGFGVTEAVMIGLFYSFGVPLEAAAAIALVDRGLFYFWGLCGGYASFLTLKVWKKV